MPHMLSYLAQNLHYFEFQLHLEYSPLIEQQSLKSLSSFPPVSTPDLFNVMYATTKGFALAFLLDPCVLYVL